MDMEFIVGAREMFMKVSFEMMKEMELDK